MVTVLVPETPPRAPKSDYGGYSYDFLTEPPQKYHCGICTRVLKDPHLTECCGHEFCKTCLERWGMSSKSKTCPHCREVNFNHIVNKQSKREIDELKVRCSHRKNGCGWVGELVLIEAHHKSCDYFQIQCSMCELGMKRMDLTKHEMTECRYRSTVCTFCGKEDMHHVIVSLSHMAVCHGYPEDCPNECGVKGVKRSEMPAHRGQCPLEVVECPFRQAGCLCTAQVVRKDMEHHIASNNQQHLLLMMAAFRQMQVSFSHVQRQLSEQGKHLKELRMFRAASEDSMSRITSEVDSLMKICPGKQAEALCSIKTLTNCSPLQLDKEHRLVALTLPNFHSFATLSVSRKSVPAPAASNSWKSRPFYVKDGYKMCLEVSIVKGHVSLLLLLLRGEFDGEIQWPCNINFNCVHVQLSTNHLINCCIGKTSILKPPLHPVPLLASQAMVWYNDKFAVLPLPPHVVQKDGSLVFRLRWIETVLEASPQSTISSLRKRRILTPSTSSQRSRRGFTFTPRPNQTNSGTNSDFAAGILFRVNPTNPED